MRLFTENKQIHTFKEKEVHLFGVNSILFTFTFTFNNNPYKNNIL